jgi:aminoglycoside/choline kinase family phosphotransferase
MITEVKNAINEWCGKGTESLYPLPPSASPRKYYRAIVEAKSYIVAYSSNIEENRTFLSFAKSFMAAGLNVPKIFFVSNDKKIYIQTDFGDDRLYDVILRYGWNEGTKNLLKKTLSGLLQFQTKGLHGLDLSRAYPRAEFDRQSIMWDLNYFKYYFLKLAELDFNEQRLEDDFNHFTDFLLKANRGFFLYRDFQTRNVMIVDGTPYFIDFQGGRKGALHYDVASLLYDAKADIPENIRTEMLHFYIEKLSEVNKDEADNFLDYFYHFTLIRMMQAMGAFGFRGVVQHKPHFIESIPYAIANVQKLLDEKLPELPYPELVRAINKLSVKQFETLV